MVDQAPRRRTVAVLGIVAAALGACAHYASLPIDPKPHLVPAVEGLRGPVQSPLSIGAVVALALENNPDLKALRLKRAVARAQAIQAGILPNPSLIGAFLPLISGVGTVPAWSIGLSQNIKAIVTYRSRRRAAEYSFQQVDADIVWQEWQVAGQARQLATSLIMGARSRPVYVEAYRLLADRNFKLERALEAGNVTLVTVAPDRVALQSARTALYALDQRMLSQMHQLDALLGLSPEVAVPLANGVDLPPFDPATVRVQLATLPERRPDLLALRMGYAAADEQVRQAILSQFPDLVLGGVVNSDNAKVINGGPNINVGLPIFDRNQGNIAIANATRAQLHADYSARLSKAVGQVGALLGEVAQLTAQLEVARHDLPAARLAAERAQRAFSASNIDERAYVDLVVNRFTKEQEVLMLEQALLDRQVAIQTLLGSGLPTARLAEAPLLEAAQ